MQLRKLFIGVFLSHVISYTGAISPITVDMTQAHQVKPRDAALGSTGKVATLLPLDGPSLDRRGLAEDRLNPDNLLPRQDLLLQWATQVEDGTLYRARMNITSEDGSGTKLLFMSRFHGFTSAVDCSVRDGDGLAIVFKEKEYLDLAKQQWGWLTEEVGNTFWMITNHKDCSKGADVDRMDQYVPYKITDVDYDDDGLTAEFVKAEKKTLQEALAYFDFELNWGQRNSRVPSEPLQRRQFGDLIDVITDPIEEHVIDPIVEGVETVGNFLEDNWDNVKDKFGDAADEVKKLIDEAGNLDKAEKWELPFNLGKSGEETKLSPDILGDKELYCIDCFARGKFDIEGKIRMEKLDIKEASFSVSPEDFLIRMKLNAKLQQSDWTVDTIPIWSIPFAAIDIPFLFHFGPEFRIDAEFGQAVKEECDFNFGFEASLPNEAFVRNDMVDQANAQFENWDKASAKPLDFELVAGEVEIDLGMTLMAVLSFGYDIFALGGYEAAIKAPLPRYMANFTTIHDEAGACEKSPDASKTGIQIEQTIQVGLNFYVGPNVVTGTDPPLVDKELFKWEKKFDPICNAIVDQRPPGEQTGSDEDLEELEGEIAALDEELEALADESADLDFEIELMKELRGELHGFGSMEDIDIPEGGDETPTSSAPVPSGTDVAPPAGTGVDGSGPYQNSTGYNGLRKRGMAFHHVIRST